MPVEWSKYPSNWAQYIRPAILKRGANRCEGSPAYPLCRAANKRPHPVTKSKVVLTIAHMDQDTDNNDGMEAYGPALPRTRANLRALCQRCHLTHDAKQHAENAAKTREAKMRASAPMLPSMDADGG